MKDFFTIKGKQWTLIATAGTLGLYESVSYCGRVGGSRDWLILGLADKPLLFADYPSLKGLRKRMYSLPEGTPGRWTKVKN